METSQVSFCITCPLEGVKKVAVVGSVDVLGHWQPEKGFELIQENNEGQKWISKQALPIVLNSCIEFKLCIWQELSQVQWEPLAQHSNHKLQVCDKAMLLEWEYGTQIKAVSVEQEAMKELQVKYTKLVNDSEINQMNLQNEIKDLKNALLNEKSNLQDANKKYANLENKIKLLEENANKKDKESSQLSQIQNELQTAQNEIIKLQKDNDDKKSQLIEANEKAEKEVKENNLQISFQESIAELKAQSSTQAPQAKELETKETTSPVQEVQEINVESQGKKGKKNKKKGKEQTVE